MSTATPLMPLTQSQKRRAAAAACAAAEVLFIVCEMPADEEMRMQVASARQAYNELKALLETPLKGGQGK